MTKKRRGDPQRRMRSTPNRSVVSRPEPTATSTPETAPLTVGDFWRFLTVERRRETIAFTVVYALFATFWLVCYPHPFVFEDSIDLIRNAALNDNFGLRPIGYSYFLGALNAVGTSYYLVMGVQFLLNFLSSVFFIATIQFFYRPTSRVVSWLFTALVLFAPSILYLNIWIATDSLYITLTLTWLALLIWNLNADKKRLVLCSSLVLFALAITRYIGITMAAVPVMLLLFKRTRWMFINAALALLIGVGTFVGTKSIIHDRWGVDTLSGISGRARMNGVGLMYPHLGDDFYQLTFDDEDQQLVHRMLSHYYQNRPECFEDAAFFNSEGDNGGGPFFMWGYDCPLSGIVATIGGKENPSEPLIQLRGAYVLDKYATKVIKLFPFAYLRYYILPNFQRLFFPEFLIEAFAYKYWDVGPEVRSWFKVEVDKLVCRWDVYGKYIRPLSSQVNGLTWFVTFAALGAVLIGRNRLGLNVIQWQILALLIGYMAVYIGFSLISHPILLRYLLPLYGPQLAVVYIVIVGLTNSKPVSVPDRPHNK